MKKLEFQVTNYEVSVYPLYMLGEVLVRDFKKVFGVDYNKFLVSEWKNRVNWWAMDPKPQDKAVREVETNA